MSVLIFIDGSSLTALNGAFARWLCLADFDASSASCRRSLLSGSYGYETYTIGHNVGVVNTYVVIFNEFSKNICSATRHVASRSGGVAQ
jgi:hypothetical protein